MANISEYRVIGIEAIHTPTMATLLIWFEAAIKVAEIVLLLILLDEKARLDDTEIKVL